MSSNKKVIIFTGGTDGIGRQTLDVLVKEENLKFILPVRNIEKGEGVVGELLKVNPNADITLMKMDLASLDSIREFVRDFKLFNLPLDILVNNAGVLNTEYKKTIDGFESTVGVNHLGVFLLSNLLLESLSQSTNENGGNLVIVASKMHYRVGNSYKLGSKDELMENEKTYSSMSSYSKSKLCNVLFAKELQKKINDKQWNIKVNAVHPGFQVTSLSRDYGYFSAAVLKVIVAIFGNSLTVMAGNLANISLNKSNIKGQYLDISRQVEPSKFALNHENQKKLWDLSCTLVNIPNEI